MAETCVAVTITLGHIICGIATRHQCHSDNFPLVWAMRKALNKPYPEEILTGATGYWLADSAEIYPLPIEAQCWQESWNNRQPVKPATFIFDLTPIGPQITVVAV